MIRIPLTIIVLFCTINLVSCSSSDEENLVITQEQQTANIPNKTIEIEILNLINQYRANKGLSELIQLDIVKTQTHEHTNYMLESSAISHDNFFKRKSYLQINANAINVGENVAYGYSSAKSVVDAWLKSDNHKKNIEGDFNYFHISAEKGEDGNWYYTNIFIKK